MDARGGDHAAVNREARAELLSAAEAAVAWFDRFDAHAPSDMHFGGEGRVRKGS